VKMKLASVLIACAHAKKAKPIYGCDPDELGHYEIIDQNDCKKWKGFNDVADANGKFLEKKTNTCPRKCKYTDDEPTTQTMCKCKRDKVTKEFHCWYQIKLVKAVKGWVPFNYTDADGNYPLDKFGEGGHQIGCVLPSEVGTWKEWGEWGACDAECGLGEKKRTRECDSEYCGDDDTETMKCVGYADYAASWSGHACNAKNADPGWQFEGVNDNDYNCHLSSGAGCWNQKFNDGHYCVLPSFGGWPDADTTFKVTDDEGKEHDENVSMGIECEGDVAHDLDKYWITGLNTKCKIVCRGDLGIGTYAPKTLFWSKFSCLEPIPIQLAKPTQCYADPNGGADLVGECLPDWQEKGLDLVTQNSVWVNYPNAVPWYFDSQIKPKSSSLGLRDVHDLIDTCYKVEKDANDQPPKCDGMPPIVDAEKEAGTKAKHIKWTCDDEDNAGSICQKSCKHDYKLSAGNTRMVCHCAADSDDANFGCSWKITQENPNPVPGFLDPQKPSDHSSMCLPGCDGMKSNWGDNVDDEYTVHCDGVDGDIPTYDWDTYICPASWASCPIAPGKKCYVHCAYDTNSNLLYGYPRDWMLENFYTTKSNVFELSCVEKNGKFEWEGDYQSCVPVCSALGKLAGEQDDDEEYFDCDDTWMIGSTCHKKCPAGQALKGSGKTSKWCKQGKYSSGWNSYTKFKDCAPV